MRKRKPVDLSQIYCHPDLDEAQRRHGELPREIMQHWAAALAFKAGLGPDPGYYSGPKPKVYDDE
jgi:hypothetical protein